MEKIIKEIMEKIIKIGIAAVLIFAAAVIINGVYEKRAEEKKITEIQICKTKAELIHESTFKYAYGIYEDTGELPDTVTLEQLDKAGLIAYRETVYDNRKIDIFIDKTADPESENFIKVKVDDIVFPTEEDHIMVLGGGNITYMKR